VPVDDFAKEIVFYRDVLGPPFLFEAPPLFNPEREWRNILSGATGRVRFVSKTFKPGRA
jgi:hypothetical protein